MLIAGFARATGLPRDTVRYYEKLGLLKPSAPRGGSNRYRQYTTDDVERASLIRLGQALGFTLREIKSLAQSMESNTLTDARKVAVMEEKIRQIETRVAQMNAIKRYFQAKVRWIAEGGIGDQPQFRGVAPTQGGRNSNSPDTSARPLKRGDLSRPAGAAAPRR